MSIDERLDRLYANRFSPDEQAAKAALWRVLCDAFFQRYVPKDATILDVGAGYCDFVNAIKAKRKLAVDLNPDMRTHASADVETYEHDLERLDDVIDRDSVDFAFASNVFEHLRGPDSLLRVLTAIRAVLRPRGQLMIMQPNVRLVKGRFWDFFDHTLPLTEKGMTEALRVAGYDVLFARPRFLPYTTKSRLPQWPWLVRAYLATPLGPLLFGKQMLVLGRKPA